MFADQLASGSSFVLASAATACLMALMLVDLSASVESRSPSASINPNHTTVVQSYLTLKIMTTSFASALFNHYNPKTPMKYTLRIAPDINMENPATDTWHTQLLIASNRHAFGTHNFTSGEACDAHLASLKKGSRIYAAPVFAYIHSGIALSLSPFSCPWDSGMIGWITVDMAALELGVDEAKQEAQRLIDDMNEYLSNEAYGWIIENEDGEHIDSCWGYSGDPEDSGCKSDGEAALAALMLNEVTDFERGMAMFEAAYDKHTRPVTRNL